jgi:hypothetical protein
MMMMMMMIIYRCRNLCNRTETLFSYFKNLIEVFLMLITLHYYSRDKRKKPIQIKEYLKSFFVFAKLFSRAFFVLELK